MVTPPGAPELLVETSWVAAHAADPDVRIIDMRPAADYQAGHIPGAVSLQEGPLRTEGLWQVTVPESDITLDGRSARVIELEGAERGAPPSHTRIIATAADNTLIYLFITTAPLTDAAQYRPTFDAMLASVKIFE